MHRVKKPEANKCGVDETAINGIRFSEIKLSIFSFIIFLILIIFVFLLKNKKVTKKGTHPTT